MKNRRPKKSTEPRVLPQYTAPRAPVFDQEAEDAKAWDAFVERQFNRRALLRFEEKQKGEV